MNPAVRLALLGFTPFEREQLESALAVERPGQPHYLLCGELAACSLALVDADHEGVVAAVEAAGRLSSAVMIGGTLRPGAAVQLPRAFQLQQLLRALDDLVPEAPPMSSEVQRVRDELAQMLGRHRRPPRAQRPRLDHLLVVDDSDAVLRFMADHLARFGFEVHLARDGSEAMRRVQERHFEFVFVAGTLDGLDGFHVCRTLLRQPYPHEGPRPMLVLLLDNDSPVQRLRAEQCGADAWLDKPLAAEPLLRVVGQREVQRHSDAQTTHASTTML